MFQEERTSTKKTNLAQATEDSVDNNDVDTIEDTTCQSSTPFT